MISIKTALGIGLLALALVVGAIASYRNVVSAHGPKERMYVFRMCILFWLITLVLLGGVYFLPPPYRYLSAAAYFVVLPIIVYRSSRTHQLIRMVEERQTEGDRKPA